jgi:hypothetical protein
VPIGTGVKVLVAFGLTLALLIGGVLGAALVGGGCMENVYEGTARGDVCGKVAFHGRGWIALAFAPAAIYLALLACWRWARDRPGRTAILIVAPAAIIHVILSAIVTSNLFA